MKTVDYSYEQALIMHDNVHIHVIMNIIMTPTAWCTLAQPNKQITKWPHQEDTGVAHGWPKSSYVVSKIGWSALSRIQQREMGDDPRDDIVVSGNLDHDRFFFILSPGW